MLTRDNLQSIANKLMSYVNGDAEVLITTKDGGATRFSNNAITQHIEESLSEIRLRVINGGRQGIATGNRTDDVSLKQLAARASLAARESEPDPAVLPLSDKQPSLPPNPGAFDPDVAAADPAWRAARVASQIKLAREKSLEAAGLLSTSHAQCFYANSNRVACYYRNTSASTTFSAFAENGAVEGASDSLSRRLAGIDADAVARAAIDKCLRGMGTREQVKAGAYDVVLSQEAMSDLMLFMAWLGFGTLRHVEGRAALGSKMGTPVFSSALSIASDPFHPLHQGRPFDMEGFATSPLRLIERGVPTDLPHDRRTAASLKAQNTGHGNLQPDSYGPMPGCLVVGTGDSSVEKMIESTEDGLLVGQFHYTNTVDPMAMTVTGMTRAGLWRIKNGKVGKPCNNLRFTDSLIRAFSNVDGVSSESRLKAGGLFGGGMVLPAVKVKGFNFSSATDF